MRGPNQQHNAFMLARLPLLASLLVIAAACSGGRTQNAEHLLKTGDTSAKIAAAREIGKSGNVKAVRALANALNAPDEDIRVLFAVVSALGSIGGPGATAVLSRAAADHQVPVRIAAIDAIGRLGERTSVPLLVPALSDDREKVRLSATAAMGEIGGELAANHLVGQLNDRSSVVQATAIAYLGAARYRQAILGLLALLAEGKGSPEVEHAAIRALERIDPDWVQSPEFDAFRDSCFSILRSACAPSPHFPSIRAIWGLQGLGRVLDRTDGSWSRSATVQEIISSAASMVNHDFSPYRIAAIQTLGILRARTQAGLLILKARGDFDTARAAAIALGEMGDSSAVLGLARLLSRRQAMLAMSAAEALGRIGHRSAVPALIERGLADPRGGVRRESAVALGRIGSTEAVAPLLVVLGDSLQSVRRAAATSLGRIGASQAVPALSDLLSDTFRDVRRAAVEALGAIGDPGATGPVLDAVSEGTLWLSDCLPSLAAIDPNWRQSEAAGLRYRRCAERLSEGSPEERYGAASIVAEVGGDEGEALILSRLMARDLPVVAGAHRLLIAKAVNGSESVLIDALNYYGNQPMAMAFLNSRNRHLAGAADVWARLRGLMMVSRPDTEPVRWGRG